MQVGDNLRSSLGPWMRDQISVQLFILFVQQNQAQLETLCSSDLLTLKYGKEISDFLKWARQEITQNAQERDLQCGEAPMEQEQQGDLKSKVKDYLQSLGVQHIEQDSLESFFQIKLNNFFRQMRKRRLINNVETPSSDLISKFKKFFKNMLQIYTVKEDGNAIAQAILTNGTLQTLRLKITQDTKRQSIKKALEISNSYNNLEKYGGKDITKIKLNVKNKLVECLLELQIPLNLIQQITKQLLENPTSNCITNLKQLSEDTKKRYYESKFYKSKILLEYSHLLSYPQTLHAKAMKEISNLTREISESVKVNNDVMKLILNFDLEGILKHRTVQHLKKIIFEVAKRDCPNFFKASQIIKYLNKQPKDFSIDSKLQKKFKLRQKFFEAKLRFQSWERVEDELFNRNDSIIHKLQLNLQQKNILRTFYNEEIEPYFHQMEKPFTYEEQIRENLLSELIQLKLEKGKELDTLHQFIDIIIKLNVLQESKIDTEELNKREKSQLINALKKNQQFKKYMNNKGKDEAQIEYKACQILKQLIYEINLQNNIEVSYESISEFLNLFKSNKLAVPQQFKKYVCDLEQLKRRYIEEGGGPSQQQLNQKRLVELKQEKKQLINSFWKHITSKCKEDSYIMRQLSQIFKGRQLEYFELLLKLNPFENGQSKLAKLQVQKSVTERYINNEAKAMNSNQIQSFIQQYRRIISQIKEISNQEIVETEEELSPVKTTMIRQESGSSQKQQSASTVQQKKVEVEINIPRPFNNEEQIQNLKRRMSQIENDFLKSYETLDNPEESFFKRNMLNKHQDKINTIVKKVLEANPFQVQDPAFFEELKKEYGLNKIQAGNIQKEFRDKAASFGQELSKEYRGINQRLKQLQ